MRFASVAYQYFLIALQTDEDCIDQARSVFSQQFEWILSQVSDIEAHVPERGQAVVQKSHEIQIRICDFAEQFERFYLSTFKTFKQQQTMLIENDPMQAFSQWTQMFDNEYLFFIRQEHVCKNYAWIMNALGELSAMLSLPSSLD